MDNIKQYVQENKERFLNELIELLKIPSVSADSAYAHDVVLTAEAVKASLEKAGCDFVELCETPGYPIVMEKKSSIKIYQRFWFMDITMCNHQIQWNYGLLHLLNL